MLSKLLSSKELTKSKSEVWKSLPFFQTFFSLKIHPKEEEKKSLAQESSINCEHPSDYAAEASNAKQFLFPFPHCKYYKTFPLFWLIKFHMDFDENRN